jgi:hypothetical protein
MGMGQDRLRGREKNRERVANDYGTSFLDDENVLN